MTIQPAADVGDAGAEAPNLSMHALTGTFADPTFAGLDPSMWYNPAHNSNPTLDREHQPFRHQNPNSNTMKIPILTLNPRHHPTRCRRCKEPDPDAAPGCDTNKHVYKFSFEYTPGAGR